jgi:hypothetical protein
LQSGSWLCGCSLMSELNSIFLFYHTSNNSPSQSGSVVMMVNCCSSSGENMYFQCCLGSVGASVAFFDRKQISYNNSQWGRVIFFACTELHWVSNNIHLHWLFFVYFIFCLLFWSLFQFYIASFCFIENIFLISWWESWAVGEVKKWKRCCCAAILLADGKPCLAMYYKHFDPQSVCITPILTIITPKGLENADLPLDHREFFCWKLWVMLQRVIFFISTMFFCKNCNPSKNVSEETFSALS